MSSKQIIDLSWKELFDTYPEGASRLEIVAACMNRFGDAGRGFSFSDWAQIVRQYYEGATTIRQPKTITTPADDLRSSIYNYLIKHPDSKASAIASFLNVKRSDVNSILYKMKASGDCRIDASYHWRIIQQEIPLQFESPSLKKYKQLCEGLHVSNRYGKKAPHKYILLISIANLIAKGEISNNTFGSTIQIEKEFINVWNSIVPQNSIFNPVYTTPFWHMMSEPFWRLYDRNGILITSQWDRPITSVSRQRKELQAEIDFEFFELLKDEHSRLNLINLLETIVKRDS